MKIVSKFQDYYDSAAQFGIDKTQVFVRKNESIDSIEAKTHFDDILDSVPYKVSRCYHDESRFSATPFILGFCGKVYLGYRLCLGEDASYNPIEVFCYSVKEIEKALSSHEPDFLKGKTWNRVLSSKALKNGSTRFSRQLLINCFEAYSGQEMASELFHGLHEPCWLVNTKSYNYRNFKGLPLEINPVLKDLGFVTVFDPFSAHQEISQYYFGVLGDKSKEPLQIEDRYLIEGKGFDTQYGFRTRPKN